MNQGMIKEKAIPKKQARGFTLIEIIVVIALISILAGIGALSARNYMPIYQLREATRDMSTVLQQARAEAVRRNTPVAVVYDLTAGNESVAVFVDNNQNFIFDAGDIALNNIAIDDYRNIRFGNATLGLPGANFPANVGGNPVVAFNNRGMSLNAAGGFGAGTIWLQNTQGRERSIVVNAAGHVRIP